MIKTTMYEVQQMVNGLGLQEKFADIKIEGVTIDSRQVTPGNLFIPIIGARVNGHDRARDAVERSGAGGTLWQKDVPNPPADIPVIMVDNTTKALQELGVAYKNQLNMKVIGITGSNGKTSTKDILASILETTFKVHKTPGNFNSEFGMPLTLLGAPTDTEVAVLEMGMRGLGQIKLLSDMAQPDISIITCIGEAHIEELGSRENISIAKYEITAGLSEAGLFVYHGDEPLLRTRINEDSRKFQMTSFGDDPSMNDYYPTEISIQDTGMAFKINDWDGTFYLPVLGKHNVINTLSAIASARHLGLSYDDIKTGMQNLEMSKMRMEIMQAKNGLSIINDAYNSSPTSVRATLELLESLEGYGKKIVVLGDMFELGEFEVKYHEDVGKLINEKKIDVLFTYGKLARHIFEQATGMKINEHFECKEALAEKILAVGTDADICLIKGSRGVKLEEVIELIT